MAKYSVLFGTDKYHVIGPFRFPIYEDLTPGETKGLEDINRKQAKSTYKSMRLAQRIAKENKMEIKQAVEILGNLGLEENEEYLYKYSEEIEGLSEGSAGATEQKIELVTLFMRYRGQVLMPQRDEWQETTDWANEDTEKMPSKMLDSIFQLLLWERDGWPEEGNSQEKTATEEKQK